MIKIIVGLVIFYVVIFSLAWLYDTFIVKNAEVDKQLVTERKLLAKHVEKTFSDDITKIEIYMAILSVYNKHRKLIQKGEDRIKLFEHLKINEDTYVDISAALK